MDKTTEKFEANIGLGLRIGTTIATLLMLLGFILLLLNPQTSTAYPHSFSGMVQMGLAGHPISIMALGLLLLILTPVLRVILSIVNFLILGNYKYVTITTIVLVILMIALWIGHQ